MEHSMIFRIFWKKNRDRRELPHLDKKQFQCTTTTPLSLRQLQFNAC